MTGPRREPGPEAATGASAWRVEPVGQAPDEATRQACAELEHLASGQLAKDFDERLMRRGAANRVASVGAESHGPEPECDRRRGAA